MPEAAAAAGAATTSVANSAADAVAAEALLRPAIRPPARPASAADPPSAADAQAAAWEAQFAAALAADAAAEVVGVRTFSKDCWRKPKGAPPTVTPRTKLSWLERMARENGEVRRSRLPQDQLLSALALPAVSSKGATSTAAAVTHKPVAARENKRCGKSALTAGPADVLQRSKRP
jgi:hypothetical protein